MNTLNSAQRKYLRSQAHHLDPVVIVGKKGVSDDLIDSVDTAIAARELIKIRFNEFKDEKKTITEEIAERTNSEVAGIIGHVAILYREHEDPEKRQYDIPLL